MIGVLSLPRLCRVYLFAGNALDAYRSATGNHDATTRNLLAAVADGDCDFREVGEGLLTDITDIAAGVEWSRPDTGN